MSDIKDRIKKLRRLALNNPNEEEARSAAMQVLKLEQELAGGPVAEEAQLTEEAVGKMRARAARQWAGYEDYQAPPAQKTYRYASDGPIPHEPDLKERAARLVQEREERIANEVSARLGKAAATMQREFDVRLDAGLKAARGGVELLTSRLNAARDECKALQSQVEELTRLLHEARAVPVIEELPKRRTRGWGLR